MKRYLLLVCLAVTGMSSGCALDRTWFQMSSNSPMPFFGFDLRFPRKTSYMEQNAPEEMSEKPEFSQSTIQTVSLRDSYPNEKISSHALQLPRMSSQSRLGTEEELSFTGPKTSFSP